MANSPSVELKIQERDRNNEVCQPWATNFWYFRRGIRSDPLSQHFNEHRRNNGPERPISFAPFVTEQPSLTRTMEPPSPSHPKNTQDTPPPPSTPRQWAHSLWLPLSWMTPWTLLCPCLVYSENRTRLHHLVEQGYPRMDRGDSCTCASFGYTLTCLLCLEWLPQVNQA